MSIKKNAKRHGPQKLNANNSYLYRMVSQKIDSIHKTIKTTIDNQTKQLEAYSNLQVLLGPSFDLPNLHGWAASPDFSLLLVRELLYGDYDGVIEFGSGSSTVLMARVIQLKRMRKQHIPAYIAFDHLENFYQQTQNELSIRGLLEEVYLSLSALVPYEWSDGQQYSYYDCDADLSAFEQKCGQSQNMMVIVDGPPASTGKHARWPVIDVLSHALPQASLDIYLDDYVREDEQEVANKWLQHSKLQNVNFETFVYPFEKHCFRLKTNQMQHPIQKAL